MASKQFTLYNIIPYLTNANQRNPLDNMSQDDDIFVNNVKKVTVLGISIRI